jgi:hypothetical protein
VWSKFESPHVDFFGHVALGFEGLESVTWGALLLVIVCEPTHGFNVISPMSSTTILRGLMNGSIYMSKILFSVCYVFSSKMTIWVNGVFMLIGGSTSMQLIDYTWLGVVGTCIA